MSQPTPPHDDASGVLKRVHQLGSATEELFSRLYGSLSKRDQLRAKEDALQETRQKAQLIARRNQKLRQMLKERSLEAKRLHAILGNISEGIIMQDSEGRILMMNDAAKALIGSQRNFWKSELGTLFNERKNLQNIGTELAPLGEAERIQVNDSVLSVQIAGVTSPQGERIGTIMILSDVTRDALAERMKRGFVTHISHELVTPLSPLRMASEVLINAPDDQPPNRRMLEMLSRNVDIMDRMINEMLDLSAMTSGDFSVHQNPLSLENLLWEIKWSHDADIADAGLEIGFMLRDTDALDGVLGDEKHLRWALTNVLRNAILYNEPDQQIILSAGINPHNANELFIEIADTGVGIAEKDMPYIFDLFFRGDPITRAGKALDPRGLGQGLFVARTIARAHGGYLYAKSTVGEGSTFTFTLPRRYRESLPEST